MRKSVKLLALSAAVLGATAVSSTSASASNVNDLINANSQVNSQLNNDRKITTDGEDKSTIMDQWAEPFEGSDLANELESQVNSYKATEDKIKEDLLCANVGNTRYGQGLTQDKQALTTAYTSMSSKDQANGKALYDAIGNELDAIYGLAQDGNNQQANQNANKQNANNNANAQAQSNSSSKKDADKVAADTNNGAKKDDANKQNANNAVKDTNKQASSNQTDAQQGVAKDNGAKAEGQKAVIANGNQTNSSNSTKTQNKDNGAIAETQAQNTTAAGETSTVVKTQAKSENNNASQKDNTPVFPQTGEKTSEILAVAGGLIIAATATGIVVYKKHN